ncbi:hypothetical protein KGM_207862A, partial [Danaus plexippus plexippus]
MYGCATSYADWPAATPVCSYNRNAL